MRIETIVTLLGIVTALMTVGQVYSWWKSKQGKSSVDVVSSAIQLLKPYQQEVEQLRTSLQGARNKIADLTIELGEAQKRADHLNTQLVDAQTEVNFLRSQVKVLGIQLGENRNDRG